MESIIIIHQQYFALLINPYSSCTEPPKLATATTTSGFFLVTERNPTVLKPATPSFEYQILRVDKRPLLEMSSSWQTSPLPALDGP